MKQQLHIEPNESIPEEDYRLLVENSREGIFKVDARGRLVFASRRLHEMLGFAAGELLGRHFSAFIAERDLPEAQRSLEQRRLGQAGLSEYRVARKDGSQVWLSVSSVPILAGSGEFLGVTGFISDIDEKKRGEERAAHELRLLQRIAGDAPLAEVLDDLCLTLESLASRPLRCSIMMADAAQDTLRCIAAPSMPKSFCLKAAYTLRDGATTCALSIRSGRPVIVADALNDGSAEDVLALRRELGYRAIWSHPILQEGAPLGSLTFLPDRPGTPSAEDARLIEFGVQVARLALAHERNAHAVRDSEQRFRAYADMAADWYWEQDAEFRFTKVVLGTNNFASAPNQHMEIVGRHRWDLPYVNVPEGFWDEHRRQLDAGTPFSNLHLQYRGADGSIHHAMVSGRPLFDGAGRLAGYRGVGSDITARVAAEAKSAEANKWLHLAVEAANVGLWERDIDSWEFRFSGSWKRLFGYGEDEIVDGAGQFDRLVHPDDLERVHACGRAYVARPEGTYSIRFRIRHKNGQWRWVLSRGNVVADAVGRRIFLGCHVDITELQQSQDALRESEQCFRDFTELAADWHWEQDAEYRFTSLSGEAFARGGFRQEDFLGHTRWETPVGVADEAFWARHRAQLDRRGAFRDLTYRVRNSRGEARWCSISGKPLFAVDDTFLGYRGTARDITAQVLAEQHVHELNATLEERVRARTIELEAANRELDAFNYSVSHDLRTPLRSMQGFSEVLLEDYAERLDEAGRDYLARIGAAAQRMGELIDAMYHLSKLSRALLRLRELSLTAIADLVVEELRQAEPAREVEVAIARGLAAEGDPDLLRIVLANLLGNAWKYTARTARPRIELGAEADAQGRRVFFVRDNGAGFDMQFADKLFKLFQRLHREEEFGGHGVGLATVQRIVGRHGGRIWAAAAKGRGATFYFTLWEDAAFRHETEAALRQETA